MPLKRRAPAFSRLGYRATRPLFSTSAVGSAGPPCGLEKQKIERGRNHICPNVLILALGWISDWLITTVTGRKRSTIERT